MIFNLIVTDYYSKLRNMIEEMNFENFDVLDQMFYLPNGASGDDLFNNRVRRYIRDSNELDFFSKNRWLAIGFSGGGNELASGTHTKVKIPSADPEVDSEIYKSHRTNYKIEIAVVMNDPDIAECLHESFNIDFMWRNSFETDWTWNNLGEPLIRSDLDKKFKYMVMLNENSLNHFEDTNIFALELKGKMLTHTIIPNYKNLNKVKSIEISLNIGKKLNNDGYFDAYTMQHNLVNGETSIENF